MVYVRQQSKYVLFPRYYSFLQFIGACKDPLMVIVTELLPGMSLRKYLMSIRPKLLDLHLAINFALDIARALDWLHANGIIHRDLKPGINLGTFFIIFATFSSINAMLKHTLASNSLLELNSYRKWW